MLWYTRIFAFLLGVRNLLWNWGVRYPVISRLLLCCILGLVLGSLTTINGPTLPWPWPDNNV